MGRSSFILLLAALCVCTSHAFVTPQTKTLMSPTIGSVNRVHTLASTSTPPPMSFTSLSMAQEGGESNLPFWLDPNTKGGVVVLGFLLFILPILGYNVATGVFGLDGIEAGKWIGVGFTAIGTFAWVATYIFRVATKDMTYAKQLKDYENAVIAKRLEELDDDEIQALVEEIERDDF